MPVYRPLQRSFLDVQAESITAVEPGTIVWLLGRYRSALFPDWLVSGWGRGAGARGRNAWPVDALLSLLLLRWSEGGMSRLGSCKRARSDLVWRYAMGLGVEGRTPTEKSMREVEDWLGKVDDRLGMSRIQALFEHVVHLALWSEQSRGRPAPTWVMDSTPMWCFGAILDTVRLLGDGLRRLGRRWARAKRISLGAVSNQWELPLLLARSTKGALRIDWRDPDARAGALSGLVDDVIRVVDRVRPAIRRLESPTARKAVADLCDVLLRVIEQDLERDERGRWRVAERVARDRLVSLTDVQARHGRKTKSETFWGYKLHVLGDAVSGVIAAVSVTPGNVHDESPGHELIARVRAMRLDIQSVLADTAYGSAASRTRMKSIGIELIAPPPPSSSRTENVSKNDFSIDFDLMQATCPNGVATDVVEPTRGRTEKLAFRWPGATCTNCPIAERCLGKRSPRLTPTGARMGRPPAGKRLVLDPLERERREARAWWADPAVRELYRRRALGERLHVELLQHGARQARCPGLDKAALQVQAIAIVVNFGVYGRNLTANLAERSPGVRRRSRPPRRASPGSDSAEALQLV